MKIKSLCRFSCLLYLCLFVIVLFQTPFAGSMENDILISATLSDAQTIHVKLKQSLSAEEAQHLRIVPDVDVLSLISVDHRLEIKVPPVDVSQAFQIQFADDIVELSVDEYLNRLYSYKPLGCTWDEAQTMFRLFAPRARTVKMILFENVEDDSGQTFDLKRDADGVWELVLDGHYFGRYYAYSVDGPDGDQEQFDPTKFVADPYSRAVATENNYLHRGKTLILDTSNYDWQGDAPLGLPHRDLIIYECHVRDLTAHPSAGADPEFAGSYKALVQKNSRGGVNHIKSLGVNAVELLPIHDFGNIEIPFNEPVDHVTNTWNPYARNHWGYMTSYFFAPESYYASHQTLDTPYAGVDGRQVDEFKDVVKAFHDEGIAVLLDVVYNHVSQYDQNCFKYIDKKYYFHLNEDGTYCSASGCGNDFKTDRPMARKLIVDSIKFWMQEYHVDGFRFDLASMIDWETIDEITREAKKINPNVILIAEPWGGGGYNPAEFSKHGWAAWNDQIRNGVKGQNPKDNHGFIFGKWFDHNNPERMKSYILGSLAEDGVLFQKTAHAINYLESHDDHTLGDFIRLGLGAPEVVEDVDENARLTDAQLALNKLGALFLLTSQGPVMLHEGQEWARSKVIAPTEVPEENVGHIDHNSYNKDNETNWLNFDHADMNAELVNYYKGLIALRKKHPAFRRAVKLDFKFYKDKKNPFAIAYKLDNFGSDDSHDFFVVMNGNRELTSEFTLPPGEWHVVVNAEKAGTESLGAVHGSIKVPPSTGVVLQQ